MAGGALRAGVAVAYVALWGAAGAGHPDIPDGLALVVWAGSSLLAGALIGRVWAVALALPAAAALALASELINPCDSSRFECDVSVPGLALTYAAFTVVPLSLGVGLAGAASEIRARRALRARSSPRP